MRTLKIVIAYDGTRYHGWQRQLNGLSVQQVLEEAVGRIAGRPATVIGSGRTDAGVHALAQVAHFRTESVLAEANLLKGINSVLPGDIAITDLREMPEGFHARFDATSKVYLYRIVNRSVRDVFERGRAWFIHRPLAVERMRQALPYFLGTHDFTSFCTVHCESRDRIRTVLDAAVTGEAGGIIETTLEADGFLRYMVRTLMGVLVDVGLGKHSPEAVGEILSARNRCLAGMTAPACGLFLNEVRYGQP